MAVKKTITITGNQYCINELLDLLCNIEYLCMVGSSRDILVHVDGDGSGDLHFFNEDVNHIGYDNLHKTLLFTRYKPGIDYDKAVIKFSEDRKCNIGG